MAFWCSRLRQLAHHSKNISYLLKNPAVSKACVADNPLISHTGFASKVRFFAAPAKANSNSNAKKTEQGTKGPAMNEQIRANVVRLVMGEEHFVISRNEALKRAKDLELDLVEVQGTANPPVCKIMDYHKEKYKKETREKEQIKIKSKDVKTLRADSKEVKFSPKTEAKDLKMKADMVKRFMDKGYRVKCTASDSEGQDLGVVFSRFIKLIEDAAYIECEPTAGRGKESFIMVRHVKFGPPKGSAKKMKAEDKKKLKSSDIGGTQADTTPLPSSDEAENRYMKIEVQTDSNGETTNKGELHMPYPQRETPTNSHISPSTTEPRIPYQRRETPPAFRNSTPHPNGIPKQVPSSPNPPGLKQQPSNPIPRRSRPPGLGYGIFSNPTGNGSPNQGMPERVPPNATPSSRH